jgi:uncharacterized damage-inducible protein DinB
MATEISRPDPAEHAEYFLQYIKKYDDADFVAGFADQARMLENLLGALPAGEEDKLHEPYTWNLKQVVGHLIDSERIFSTRILRISVGDETPNPDFEQNSYVDGLDYDRVSMRELLDEFAALRTANVLLIKRLTTEQLARSGTASGRQISARAALFVIAGHFVYHYEIMQKRLGA